MTVDDPDGAVGSNQLINGIQELRDAGAEAIEINNTVRVVAQTSLRDGRERRRHRRRRGDQPRRTSSRRSARRTPWQVPSSLRRGFTYEVERVGGSVGVARSDSVEVATVHEPPTSQYADPVPTE